MHYRSIHIGLLILRIGLGVLFLIHGVPKLLGGIEKWTGLGKVMSNFGINFTPAFWGFMAAFSESFGAIALITGLFFRPAAFMMATTMFVAASMHYVNGDAYVPSISYPIELLVVFIALSVAGPGNFTIAEIFNPDGQD